MIFYSVSPFATPYREQLGRSEYQPSNYQASWRQVRDQFPKNKNLDAARFPRAGSENRDFEPESTSGFRHRSEVAVFDLTPPSSVFSEGDTIVEHLRLSVYPHGTALLECVWRIEEPDFTALNGDLVDIHERVLESVGGTVQFLLASLSSLAFDAGILAKLPAKTSATAQLSPRWTSGAMILDAEVVPHTSVAEWLGAQGIEDAEIAQFCSGDRNQVANWMRYVYRIAQARSSSLLDSQEIRPMRYCQYIYAAAEIADEELSVALGRSYDNVRHREVSAVRTTLNESANRLRVLDLEHSALLKKISPGERSAIAQILTHWEFSDLVVQPAEAKGTAARERLAELTSRNQRTAALISEVILLGIALTSLFATVLALMQYGRSMVSDPTYSSYAQESGSFLDQLSGVSTNAMLIGTFTICIVLSAAYLAVKMRDR
ncbi:hypothetical protein [Gordonia alkaliphila]|uniref:Uncharacterized protein n=1 Tax=Gordonia alkaliphila TaxID=1053547 RepID=A0ABP8YZG0_9ACTN